MRIHGMPAARNATRSASVKPSAMTDLLPSRHSHLIVFWGRRGQVTASPSTRTGFRSKRPATTSFIRAYASEVTKCGLSCIVSPGRRGKTRIVALSFMPNGCGTVTAARNPCSESFLTCDCLKCPNALVPSTPPSLSPPAPLDFGFASPTRRRGTDGGKCRSGKDPFHFFRRILSRWVANGLPPVRRHSKTAGPRLSFAAFTFPTSSA